MKATACPRWARDRVRWRRGDLCQAPYLRAPAHGQLFTLHAFGRSPSTLPPRAVGAALACFVLSFSRSTLSNLASPRGFEAAETARDQADHAPDRADLAGALTPPRQPNPANVGDAGRMADDSIEVGGVVESALAEGITIAARAGQWSLVSQLAAELEARRMRRGESAAAEVVSLTLRTPKRA